MSPPHGDHAQQRIVRWWPSSSTARHLHPPAPSSPCGPHRRIVLSVPHEASTPREDQATCHTHVSRWPGSEATRVSFVDAISACMQQT